MSTKSIEIVLRRVRAGNVARGDDMDAALAELEAIRKAAHLVTVVGQSEAAMERYPEWVEACELLRSISTGAP